MKPLALLILVSLLLFSCSRQTSIDSAPATLQGNWRMIIVKDNHSGLITTKPANVQGNVDITFTAINNNNAGVILGCTPTNRISQSGYSIGMNQQLAVSVLNMTKVQETVWGSEFVDHIRGAQQYHFESNGKLAIETTENTLIFERLHN